MSVEGRESRTPMLPRRERGAGSAAAPWEECVAPLFASSHLWSSLPQPTSSSALAPALCSVKLWVSHYFPVFRWLPRYRVRASSAGAPPGRRQLASSATLIAQSAPRPLRTPQWREGLLPDLIAGLTVGVLSVPQGLSYAVVAGLPPAYGLYNSFLGAFPYFLLGASPHIVMGPSAVISIMVRESSRRPARRGCS